MPLPANPGAAACGLALATLVALDAGLITDEAPGHCMELVVFDLDGTLLNRDSALSPLTVDTLRRLSERGIAYTVATGRMLHGSREILEGHGFRLPHVLKNGVMVWSPESEQ
jgi:hypothetical protein